jgi:hypothetical protein
MAGEFYGSIDFGGGALVSSGLRDAFVTRFSQPTVAVAITSFEAHVLEGAVGLRSSFTSDLRVLGVNIYRGEDPGGLLLIKTVQQSGQEFYCEDRDVVTGRTYYYQIGVVDRDGEFFSPIATVTTRGYDTALLPNVPNPFSRRQRMSPYRSMM